MAATKRVLIIQTAFLGDLLLSVPLFKYLKSTFPTCEISLVCRQGLGSLLKSLGLVDHLYEIQKKNKESYRQVAAQLSVHEFDCLLCPHESLTSATLARGLKAKRKIGFWKWWNAPFFGERIRKDKALPDSLRQLSLLQDHDPNLKSQIQEFHRQDLEWKKKNQFLLTPVPDWASPVISNRALSSLPEVPIAKGLQSPYICLFPGSVWKTKQWTEEGFMEVGQKWAQKNFQVVIMGGAGEEELASRLQAQIPRSVNLAGQTSLLESLAILSRARLVITNDSAGQHLAALVQAPTISIFGPTVLEFGYRPWNSLATVVERKGLACRPCGKHGHNQCPLGTHECMKGLGATEVLASAQAMIEQTQSQS